MKSALFLAAIFAAPVVFASSANITLSNDVSQIKMDEARFEMLATETKIVEKDNCFGDQYPCTEEVVVASKPMVRVYVSYQDQYYTGERNEKTYTSALFSPSDFSAEDVAALKEASRPFHKPFSKFRTEFAKRNFSMKVGETRVAVQVLDMKNSKICNVNGEGGFEISPTNCREHLVYKTEYRKAKLVVLSTK